MTEVEANQLKRTVENMPMNWKRGLVRAWIVISVLWISSAIWLSHPLQKVHHTNPDPVFWIRGNGIRAELGTDIETIRDGLTKWTNDKNNASWHDLNQDGIINMVNYAIGDYEPKSWIMAIIEELYPSTAFFVLPLFVLLAGGFLGVWIVRGFGSN